LRTRAFVVTRFVGFGWFTLVVGWLVVAVLRFVYVVYHGAFALALVTHVIVAVTLRFVTRIVVTHTRCRCYSWLLLLRCHFFFCYTLRGCCCHALRFCTHPAVHVVTRYVVTHYVTTHLRTFARYVTRCLFIVHWLRFHYVAVYVARLRRLPVDYVATRVHVVGYTCVTFYVAVAVVTVAAVTFALRLRLHTLPLPHVYHTLRTLILICCCQFAVAQFRRFAVGSHAARSRLLVGSGYPFVTTVTLLLRLHVLRWLRCAFGLHVCTFWLRTTYTVVTLIPRLVHLLPRYAFTSTFTVRSGLRVRLLRLPVALVRFHVYTFTRCVCCRFAVWLHRVHTFVRVVPLRCWFVYVVLVLVYVCVALLRSRCVCVIFRLVTLSIGCSLYVRSFAVADFRCVTVVPSSRLRLRVYVDCYGC